MTIVNALAGIAVKDLEAGIDWYTRVLGRAPDQRPMPEVAEWRFPRGGWLQVFADPERAGSSSITLAVDDLDAQVAALKKIGVAVGDVTDSAEVRTAMVSDPDGNRLVVAQALTTALAQ